MQIVKNTTILFEPIKVFVKALPGVITPINKKVG